jgi:hypothetical protein
MQTVVIGPRTNDTSATAAPPGSQPPPYWYDADCPAGYQHGPNSSGVQGGYPAGPYPTQATYPPQPATAAPGPAGSSALVLGQPVTGMPAVVAQPLAQAATAAGRASLESGHVGAAAGAAAAAGAGAVGAAGQQQQGQQQQR